jgi:prevent-host-death family protein
MADQVNIHAAKTHFSRLVERAEAGEEIVIARDGRPVARLVPLRAGAAAPAHTMSREAVAAYGSSASPAVIDWLPAIVGRLVRAADPIRIILFGSRATGQERIDSDYDLLVVVDRVENRREARIALGRAIVDVPVALDLVVVPHAEVEPEWPGPRGIAQWATDTGRTIYERG